MVYFNDVSCLFERAERSAVRAGPSGSEQRGVTLGFEADLQLAAGFEDRPLDHRRLVGHQGNCLVLRQRLLVRIRELAERGPGPIDHGLPPRGAAPLRELGCRHAGLLVVVEVVRDTTGAQPCKRLRHGAAVFDAIDGDGHFHSPIDAAHFVERSAKVEYCSSASLADGFPWFNGRKIGSPTYPVTRLNRSARMPPSTAGRRSSICATRNSCAKGRL